MPDLSHAASNQYWYEFVDPSIYRVLMFLESVESWTLDGDPELEKAIAALGKELDDIEMVDLGLLAQEKELIDLIANIKSSRGLRILQALDTAHPGSAAKVLMYAEDNVLEDNPSANFFLKRNVTFERLRLLSRIFSEARLKLVTQALEGDD